LKDLADLNRADRQNNLDQQQYAKTGDWHRENPSCPASPESFSELFALVQDSAPARLA